MIYFLKMGSKVNIQYNSNLHIFFHNKNIESLGPSQGISKYLITFHFHYPIQRDRIICPIQGPIIHLGCFPKPTHFGSPTYCVIERETESHQFHIEILGRRNERTSSIRRVHHNLITITKLCILISRKNIPDYCFA